MSAKHQFIRDILTGNTVLSALLEAGNASLDRKLATLMLIAEEHKPGYNDPALVSHLIENYIKVLEIIESYNIQLPEEISVIESVISSLTEDGEGAAGGGGAPAISGGSGAAAGQVSTQAIAASRQVDTEAIDAKTPRIYTKKKKPVNPA